VVNASTGVTNLNCWLDYTPRGILLSTHALVIKVAPKIPNPSQLTPRHYLPSEMLAEKKFAFVASIKRWHAVFLDGLSYFISTIYLI
jgi:hypothetical protein